MSRLSAQDAFLQVCGYERRGGSPWVASGYVEALDWAETWGDFRALVNQMRNNPIAPELVPTLEEVWSRRKELDFLAKQPQNARLFSIRQAAAIRAMFSLMVESGAMEKVARIELAELFGVKPENIRDVVKRRHSYRLDP